MASGEKQSSSKGALQCRVKLLGGSEIQLELDKKEQGQFVFDQVLRRLGLTDKDKDYFGLEYEDDQKQSQWLDLQKPVKKQMKKSPFMLMFKVRHYPLDPVPHPGCRTHFYRQIRRDLIATKMRCPVHTIPDVIASILQADMGDFESVDQDIEFMTDQGLIIDPTLESAAVQDEVIKLHRLHRGKTPQDAVKAFLRKVRDLDGYGIKLFDVKHDDSACQLGLSPQGVSLFRRNRRLFVHDWLAVCQISFKTKKFIIMVEKDIGGGELQLVFELDSMKSSKELWSAARSYAEFYTEPRRRVKEEPDTQTQNLRSPGALPSHTEDHFTFPQALPTQHSAQVSQDDANKFLAATQKVKSLPRYLPTSGDPVAAALKLNRRQKSASPEHTSSTSNSTGDRQTLSSIDKPVAAPQHDVNHRSHDQQQQSHDQRGLSGDQHQQQQKSHDQRQWLGGHQQPHDPRQWSHDQQQQQSHDQHQWSHDQQQWSHDQQQWSHDQSNFNAGHYDSLNCRDEYLAQQKAQGEEPYAVPRPARVAEPTNQVSASRSHSTINPDDLSQDQDMDGSLLDLADELGDGGEGGGQRESPRTGQNRRMGDIPVALQTSDSNVGRSPGRTANQHVGYNSYTLPHSFSTGDRSPRRWTGGSPRRQRTATGGGSDDDSGPPKPPRTDFPRQPEHNGRVMSGNSPCLPGSSYTTGRQHDKKRNLVRTWVQDQQLRAHQSSSSQGSSTHGSPSAHRQPQQSHDSRGMQNGHASPHSSASSGRKLSETSPPDVRSRDRRHHSVGSSPPHARSHATERLSHDQLRHPPDTVNVQPVQLVKPVSPKQARLVPPSPPAPGKRDSPSSDSSPSHQQPYRQRPSETLSHLQSDPQVPALIKEIDDLMGGLFDSPLTEPKRTHEVSPRPPSDNATVQSDPPRAAVSVQPNRLVREREEVEEKSDNGELDDDNDVVFPKNFNPADFVKDENIKIDPRNFLNTPSPEPNLLELKGALTSAPPTGGHLHSPLVGGMLSTRLQAAMDEEADYHDPPPPPPHLMALTHGFKGPPHGKDAPATEAKKKPPPPQVSPKPRMGVAGPVQVESQDVAKRSGKPPSAYPANLPPEIANFVTRVRNRSLDGGDSSLSLGSGGAGGQDPQHGRQASVEIPRPPKEQPKARPTSAVEKVQRSPARVSPTYDVPRSSVSPTFDPLTVKVTASTDGQGPATVERVTITPDLPEVAEERTNLSMSNQNGRPSSSEMSPSTGSYPSAAAVYPEAYNTGAVKEPSASGEKGGRIGEMGGLRNGVGPPHKDKQQPGQDASGRGQDATGRGQDATGRGQGMYSYDYYKQQLAGQNTQPSVTGWDGGERVKRERGQQISPPQPPPQGHTHPPHQQYQLRSQPVPGAAAATKNAPVNGQRGQPTRYSANQRHESHGSSDGSAPTTPHAQSDTTMMSHAGPRSPTGVAPDSLGYRYPPSYGASRPPNSRSRTYYHPNQQQPPSAGGSGYYPPPQDIRRTQTFSMGQGGNRPTRTQPYHRHPGGEDSLPNSPTYLAQNPPLPPHPQSHDRQGGFQGTAANYRSFQEHLEKLNTTQHGRKMRVLDWMQNQQQQPKPSSGETRQMIRDPQAGIPSRPYQKQTHIYASAAELDPPDHTPYPSDHTPYPSEQTRPWSAQGQGQGGAAYPTNQDRGRLNTFPYAHSGAPYAPQRSHAPVNSQVERGRSYVNVPPHAGNVARGGFGAGMPASAQNLPTAKFEKDYYILDV